jgi:hypothetical protein
MLAGSLITASSLMRPWQEGQLRTSTAKVRAKSSAHGRYAPAGPVRSGSARAAAGSSVGKGLLRLTGSEALRRGRTVACPPVAECGA